MVKLKRIYEAASEEDGDRFLVDRLWPRGVSREKAHLTAWLKELAPGEDLRRWFAHTPRRWDEFKRRYRLELRAADKEIIIEDLAHRAKQGTVTLVFAAKDVEHNNALVLKEAIESALEDV